MSGFLSTNVVSINGGASQTDFSLAMNIGKVKKDNTYWAFGGQISTVANKTNSPNYTIAGPGFERGRFVSIVPKLYLAPYFGGSIQGVFGEIKGYALGAYAVPIRVMYSISNNLLITAGFGSARMEYNKYGSSREFKINASLANDSGFGAFFMFK